MAAECSNVTVGIDLSTNDMNVGIVKLTWHDGEIIRAERCRVPSAVASEDPDEALAAFIESQVRDEDAVVAVDVPFGWPNEFAEGVQAQIDGRTGPMLSRSDTTLRAQGVVAAATRGERLPGSLLLRATDHFVRLLGLTDAHGLLQPYWPGILADRRREALKGLAPFSAVADRIALTTMRWFRVRRHHGVAQLVDPSPDKSGVIEVYPSATRRLYGIASTAAKSWDELCRHVTTEDAGIVAPPLRARPEVQERLQRDLKVTNAHVRDAFIAALTARHFQLGRTVAAKHVLQDGQLRLALTGERDLSHALARIKAEGWIHLPC